MQSNKPISVKNTIKTLKHDNKNRNLFLQMSNKETQAEGTNKVHRKILKKCKNFKGVKRNCILYRSMN